MNSDAPGTIPETAIDRIAYFLVIALGIVLLIVGLWGAAQTHLAPDCPGPSLSCFHDVNATLNAEVNNQ